MCFQSDIALHFAARTPLLYALTWEEDRVCRDVVRLASTNFDSLVTWSVTTGFVCDGHPLKGEHQGPLAALEYIAASKKSALYIMLDYHPYIKESKVNRKLRELVNIVQKSLSSILFISPTLNLPVELEKDIVVLDYPLPARKEILETFSFLEQGVTGNEGLSIELSIDDRERLLDACLGLTETEIKNVLTRALVSDSRLSRDDLAIVLSEKKQIIRKSGILEYWSSTEEFRNVGGMELLKEWLNGRAASFAPEIRSLGLPYPKGLLLTGVPGCGKSLIAKSVATTWGQPLLKLDVGKLYEGLVGSSEDNIRKTLKTAEAVAPAILWIDEIEKGFSGVSSGGDSGTSARVFSTFLTWMQEKTSSVFVLATANNIESLPAEMLRKGRFDEIFFVDLPTEQERAQIFSIHLKRYSKFPQDPSFDIKKLASISIDFSGSEIAQVVIEALYLALEENGFLSDKYLCYAVERTIPLAHTMREPIDRMRQWAKSRARSASGTTGLDPQLSDPTQKRLSSLRGLNQKED